MILSILGLIIIAVIIFLTQVERDPKLPKEVIRRLERPMRKKINRRKRE